MFAKTDEISWFRCFLQNRCLYVVLLHCYQTRPLHFAVYFLLEHWNQQSDRPKTHTLITGATRSITYFDVIA